MATPNPMGTAVSIGCCSGGSGVPNSGGSRSNVEVACDSGAGNGNGAVGSSVTGDVAGVAADGAYMNGTR